MSALRFDHAVIVVPELEAAAEAYRTQGLEVVPGGRHEGLPTHNTLIPVADGAYLELLTTVRPRTRTWLRFLFSTPFWPVVAARRPPVARRFLTSIARGTGLQDFALVAVGMDEVVRRARAAGLAFHEPVAMGRARPDGTRLAWRLAVPHASEVPFLIEDSTPRALRAPAPGAARAVPRVREITVSVRDVDRSAERYAALLGPEHPGVVEGVDRVFTIGPLRVRLTRGWGGVPDVPAALALTAGPGDDGP